ncbi:RNA polymerase sigma factor [Conexibacter woesei]|uniref:RNA polymerase sigma factor n=1 Tax=Conexibacter woesei TaxID=191495 RepID=UPI0022ABCC14|nr:sigma-70 family RNA polymerase sigma factor [Conexibacter woesei]
MRTDEQLVALFRAGHDEAFGTIHDRYRARLFAYARQMLGGSRSDAEDVLQDVFLRAYNALRTDGRDVALRAWLYRVAHNRCIDQLRRPAPAAEDIYDINRGVSTDLLAEAERREDLRRLIADVRELPEQQRSALLMREMEGLSYNDLAAALGVTVPAVKSLLVRARVGLVEAIEARDTACVEIRDDLASAFDRGVRPSGRAKRHLKECAGCREYRGALRGLDKSLNGLALPTGPLTMVMKVLGIGGAGSGAAAGGGAAVVGGGGASAAAGSGAVVAGGASVATTVGGGVVAATATKVAAVVAAAAVVGGGAAVEQHHARHAAAAAPAAHVAVVPQRREDLQDVRAVRVSRAAVASRQAARDDAKTAVGAQVTKLQAGRDAAVASTGANAVADQTTGGTTAPDDATPDPAASGTTAPTWSGASSDTTAADPTTRTSTDASGTTAASGTGTTTGSASGTTTATGTTTSGTQASSASTTTTATSSTSSGTGTGNGGSAAPVASSPPAATPSQPAG